MSGGFLGDLLHTGVDIAAEVGSHALTDTPILGIIPGLVAGAMDSNEATNARMHRRLHEGNAEVEAADNAREAHHSGRMGYDILKAVPVLGAGLGVAEMLSGGANWATGGNGGYNEGRENFRDGVVDMMSWVTGGETNASGTRHEMERARARGLYN